MVYELVDLLQWVAKEAVSSKKYYIVWLLNIKKLWFYHEVITKSKLEYIVIIDYTFHQSSTTVPELDSSFVSTYNKHSSDDTF